jgi:3-oxoadipate enol-lactonase
MIAELRSGLRLAYDEAGSGAALLLVHGWPHDRTLWHAQLNGLATHARCIAPDLRGFGGSDGAEPFTIEQYANDLVGLLDQLAIPEAVVCGLSMGGYVAFAMLRRHRSRVRGLVLTGTRAAGDTPEQRATRERIVAFAQRSGVDALATQQVERMVGTTTRESRPALGAALRAMMAAAPMDGVIGGQRAMMSRADSSAMLASIDVPVLVVAGAEDAIILAEEQRAMAESIPGAQYVELAGAGHLSPFERAGAFNHALGEFMEKAAG